VNQTDLEYAIETELENNGFLDEDFLAATQLNRSDLVQRFLSDSETTDLMLKLVSTEIAQNISVDNYLEDISWLDNILNDPGHWSHELNERYNQFSDERNLQHQIQREIDAERNLKNAIWLLKEHGYRITAPKK
jgi:hypothetical protein